MMRHNHVQHSKFWLTYTAEMGVEAANAVEIAEANQSGLSRSRDRRRYLENILATSATVTNEFCLGETEKTTNVYLKAYINFIRNFVTELLLHFGGLLFTVFETIRPLDQCGHRTNKKSEVILGHLNADNSKYSCLKDGHSFHFRSRQTT